MIPIVRIPSTPSLRFYQHIPSIEEERDIICEESDLFTERDVHLERQLKGTPVWYTPWRDDKRWTLDGIDYSLEELIEYIKIDHILNIILFNLDTLKQL